MTLVPSASPVPLVSSPPPRSLRAWYCACVVIFLTMLTGLGWFARGYDEIFNQMEMRQLPLPTEGILALGRFIRTAVGILVVIGVAAALVTLTILGAFDKFLVKLIVLNCIAIGLVLPVGYLSLHMPIVHIQRALEDR